MSQPDVLILGGGVIGLSCAWRLAQNGLSVTVVEQRRCGAGASNAALGSLSPSRAANIGALQRLHQQSLWAYPAFVSELEQATGCRTGYRQLVRYEIYDKPHQIEAMRADVDVANREWPVMTQQPIRCLLIRDDICKQYTGVNAVGVGALRCHNSAVIQPALLIDALIQACRNERVEIVEQHAVEDIHVDNDRVSYVAAGQRKWNPGTVLVTTGAWTERLGSMVANLAPVAPVKGQGMRVRLKDEIPHAIFKRGALYFLPVDGNEWFIGATTEKNAGFDESPTGEGIESIRSMAVELFPGVQHAETLQTWAGLRPCSRDKKPVLGKVSGKSNLFFATGHFKIGIGLAPLTASILCDEITGVSHSYDLEDFQAGRWS